MKYTLNEDIRHILEERFLLNEGLSFTDLTSYSKDICDYISELQNTIRNSGDGMAEKEQAFDQISEQTAKLLQSIRKVKEINLIKTRAEDYIGLVANMFKVIDPDWDAENSEQFGDFFYNLKELIKSPDDNKTELLTELNKLSALVTDARRKLSNKADGGNNVYDKTTQLKILARIFDPIYKVSVLKNAEYDATKEKVFEEPITDLHKLSTAAAADKSQIGDFITKCDQVLNNKEFMTAVSEINVSNKELKAERNKNVDWDQKFQNIVNKDIFWKEYYESVWGDNAEQVKMLGPAFRRECETFGFTESANPFISFIQKYIVNNSYIIDEIHYNAIHNAVANHWIEKTDLVTPKNPLTDDNMIIFWKDYYAKPGADAAAYLEALHAIAHRLRFEDFKTIDPESVAEENKNIISKLQEADSHATLVHWIMSDSNPLASLSADSGTTVAGSKILRPIAELNQLLKALDVKGKDKKPWTAAEIPTLVAALETDSVFKANPKAWAKKFIRVIADSQPIDDTTLTKLAAYESAYGWFKTIVVSPDDRKLIIKTINKYGGVISWTMLDKIAKEFNSEKRKWLE